MATRPTPGKDENTVRITGKGMEELAEALKLLADIDILVGYPEDAEDAERHDESGKPEDLTNATLAYIHDNGAPEANIPARPFMAPGIKDVEEKLADKLGEILKAVLIGKGTAVVERGLIQVGTIAALGIQKKINEGIPPPLSDYTLRQRMKNNRKNGGGARKGAKEELDRRGRGEAPSTEFAKTLVDTAQMRNATTYALRSKKQRK